MRVKKFTLILFSLGFFLSMPQISSASIVSDFVSWLVPQTLKTSVESITTKGVGGIAITPDPAVSTGDTSSTFYLPALGRRTFIISNEGTLDLFLNASAQLRYQVSPQNIPGDVPGSYALNVGKSRVVTIINPSGEKNLLLSKTDLGIVSSTAVQMEPTLFITEGKATARAVTTSDASPRIASFTFSFIFNNATNKDVYMAKLIDPFTAAILSPVPGAVTSVKFVEASPRTLAGDSEHAFVIPAGTNRAFEITGIIDVTKGIPGSKNISLKAIEYSENPSMNPPQYLTDIQNLVTPAIELGERVIEPIEPRTSSAPSAVPSIPNTPSPSQSTAEIPRASITPVISITPRVSSTPSPNLSKSPQPSTSSSPSPRPSGEKNPVSVLMITDASTKIGSAIRENGQIVGYPITFVFTAETEGQILYISKNPTTAFSTEHSGFGSIVPSIMNISAAPAVQKGDGANYFALVPGVSRTFSASTIMRNDGVVGTASRIFEITKIHYGNKTSNLRTHSTFQNVANLRAIVRLSPKPVTPSPSVSSTPSTSPSPSSTLTPLPSVSPDFNAICYATPQNPLVGDTVYWQVAVAGGTSPFTYSWSGTDGVVGSTYITSIKYGSSGRKTANVEVSSGGKTVTSTCYVTVSLTSPSTPSSTPVPSSSSSPSPSTSSSSSPAPSGSSVGFNSPAEKGIVASVLFGIGDFLDSLLGR